MTTNSTPPDPSYTSGPNSNGFIYRSGGDLRLPVELWFNAATQHASAVSSPAARLLLQQRGFAFVQVLGYVDLPGTPRSQGIWSFGVSGEVESVPSGFSASTIVRLSTDGINSVVDGWGAAMRRAYNTTKLADEDIFLAALSLFTDNGATTLGLDWPSSDPPPAGGYRQLNWTAVQLGVLEHIVADVANTSVPVRSVQWDAWWYPAQSNVTASYLVS